MTSALLTSTTESNPKPTSAMEPAMMPLTIAITASRLFHAIVDAVSAHAQRRRFRSLAGASNAPFTGAAQQEHPSAQVFSVVSCTTSPATHDAERAMLSDVVAAPTSGRRQLGAMSYRRIRRSSYG
jgi:hypothetical protein